MGVQCPKCHYNNPPDTAFCGKCATPLPESHDFSPTRTLETPIEELTTGSTLANRYQVIEELGQGGMGRVYKVLDMEIKEKVALKLISPAIASEKKTLLRFRNELKVARQISHKNVCRMYHFGEDKGTYFITMEYVPGEDLKSTIRRIGQLQIEKSIAIAKQVCEGLFEAHRMGVIHRDLKPRNIMIDQFGNAKIMDFGIARAIKSKGITKEGMAIGTPEYMPPEQVKGENTDRRSDIYSIGVTLFEMVTGKVPFEGDSSLSIAVKHKTEPPPNPSDLNYMVSEQLSRLILKCLEKDMDKRFQTTEELCEALSKVEEDISTGNRAYLKRDSTDETRSVRFWPFYFPRIILPVMIVAAALFILIPILSRNNDSLLSAGRVLWKTSIAVLPIEDVSESGELQTLSNGFTDSIIRNLTKIRKLKVKPTARVSPYLHSEKSPREIGIEMDVKIVLKPIMKRIGNIVQIQGDLINIPQDFKIHSFSEEYKIENIINIPVDISKTIAEKLQFTLSRTILAAMNRGMTDNISAYNYFIKGMQYEKEYDEFERQEDGDNAVLFLNNAIGEDNSFALAHWHLGNVYHRMFALNNDFSHNYLMEKNYQTAYDLDRKLAEANTGLGWVSFYNDDLDAAFKYYKRAVELDPNNVDINHHVAGFLRDIGLYSHAVKLYSRAFDIDPMNTDYHYLKARCFMNSGEFENAELTLRNALLIEPQDTTIRLFLARQLLMMKQYEEAEEEIDRAYGLDPENEEIEYIRALNYARLGIRDKALSILEGLDKFNYTTLISSVYALLGMNKEALANLNQVIEQGSINTQTYPYCYPVLATNPFYGNLRIDPNFIQILEEAEKKHNEILKKYGNF
ncbi:protein kinase [Acidobacteriota bacterium]